MERGTGGRPADFDAVWHGARVLLDGRNPYAAICHRCEIEWTDHLYYPATALVAVAPFTALPLPVARVLWVAGGAALLCFGLTRDGWHRLPLFLSAPFFVAAGGGQWSIVIAAAVFWPVLGVVASMKPTLGSAVVAAAASQRDQIVAVAGGLLFLLASLAVRPSWPAEWLQVLADAPQYSAPIAHLTVGGPLVLLALLRWRRPDARLLVALACVPQSTILYEGLYFLLYPRTLRGVLAMAIASYGALWLQDRIADAAVDTASLQWAVGDVLVVFFYLPALVMVLRRENDGPVPRWLDAVAARVATTGHRLRVTARLGKDRSADV